MTEPRQLGKKAFRIEPTRAKQLLDSHVKALDAEVNKVKKQGELTTKVLLSEEKQILAEIANKGSVSEGTVRESLTRGILAAVLLSCVLFGEFVWARWVCSYFGLGQIETLFVAVALVIIFLKAFDQYLEALRRYDAKFEARVFLILGCVSVVTIFLIIFFSADIRQEIQKTNIFTNMAQSPEDIVHYAVEFYEKNSRTFIWQMTALSLAFVIVGGISFHEAKNRILFSLRYLKDYRRLRRVRQNLWRNAETMVAQDERTPRFIAEFERGLMEAEVEATERKSRQEAKKESKSRVAVRSTIIRILWNPISLLIFALILFLLLRGIAEGGVNYIIFNDISGSEAVEDYLGQETEFTKNQDAIENFISNQIAPGDNLRVIAITEESFSHSFFLLNESVSSEKGAFGEVLAREKLRLLNLWKKLDLKPTAKATDIFGAVNLAAVLFQPSTENRKIVFFSDMRHCTRHIDLEKPERINVDRMLAKVTEMGLVPSLDGVVVYCFGVHTAGKSPAYWHDLKTFWKVFFNQAKAKLLVFTMERRFSNE